MNTPFNNVSVKPLLGPLAIFIALGPLLSYVQASAQDQNQVVRIARLTIDSNQLVKYKAALREEIETSIRLEPGVLTLYAVEEKGQPGEVTIFEVYANLAAYKSHLETPHFKKYKAATKDLVQSLKLMEANAIVLAAKPAN